MTGRRQRVLVEHENPRVRERQAATLETAGFEVHTCPGPRGLESGVCPLVTGGHCALAQTADVILNSLPIGLLGVFIAQRVHLPEQPLLLGMSERDRTRLPVLPLLASTLPRDADGDALVRAIRNALDDAHDPDPLDR